MKTFMYTDWIEVHDHGSVYMTRVFLTDKNEAYMIRRSEIEEKFFRVNPELLKLGELGFFEKVMESAVEMRHKNQLKVNLLAKLL